MIGNIPLSQAARDRFEEEFRVEILDCTVNGNACTCPPICKHGTAENKTCFARGTKIYLTDGTEKKIEEIELTKGPSQIGDLVFSLNGKKVYAVGKTIGLETVPMVRLVAEPFEQEKGKKKEYTLLVSAFHSVIVRYNFLTFANILRPGDTIHTLTGLATIKEVEYVDYEDLVFNLILANEEFINTMESKPVPAFKAVSMNSMLGLAPKDHVIYSDGIASADWTLQVQLYESMREGKNLQGFS